jgi:hypothetical protein
MVSWDFYLMLSTILAMGKSRGNSFPFSLCDLVTEPFF